MVAQNSAAKNEIQFPLERFSGKFLLLSFSELLNTMLLLLFLRVFSMRLIWANPFCYLSGLKSFRGLREKAVNKWYDMWSALSNGINIEQIQGMYNWVEKLESKRRDTR